MTTTTQDSNLGEGETQTNEGHAEDYSAQMLANQIKRESRLRDIIEQSAGRFFFGDTMIVISLRVVALLVFGYLYFRAGMFSTVSFWPILAFGGIIEAIRANRRLDALIELERIKAGRSSRVIPPTPVV